MASFPICGFLFACPMFLNQEPEDNVWYFHPLSLPFMPWQCLLMHRQPIYDVFPVVPLLGSPRCLWYCNTQGSTVFLYAVYPVIFFFILFSPFGLPHRLIPCTHPSCAIFGYPLSFILIKWQKYPKHFCHSR